MITMSDDLESIDDEEPLEVALVGRRERKDRRALGSEGIAEQNRHLLRRYRDFRSAADAIVDAWRGKDEVVAVALIGSVAREPWKEVPRFNPYRRAGMEIWHECKDIDLALWQTKFDGLDGLRRAKDRTLRERLETREFSVATHQVDIFVLEPGTDRYLGRLCDFNRCPRGRAECEAPRCGATSFLRQNPEFNWWPIALAPDRVVTLFDRNADLLRRSSDLPLPSE
jgi:hypothetical protein